MGHELWWFINIILNPHNNLNVLLSSLYGLRKAEFGELLPRVTETIKPKAGVASCWPFSAVPCCPQSHSRPAVLSCCWVVTYFQAWWLWIGSQLVINNSWGLSGGPLIKNLPANAGIQIRSLVQEDFMCHGSTKPWAATTEHVV